MNINMWLTGTLPEILLITVGVVIFVADLLLSDEKKTALGWITFIGLGLVLLISVAVGRPGEEGELIWGGMVRFDWLGFIFKMIFLFGAAMTALFAMDHPKLGQRGEFYLLLLVSTLGMSLMASSANLVMLYLAIETTSIPMYILAGFMTQDNKSTEAGFKYMLFGAMASAIMLYGFSLLYGFGKTTNIYELASGLAGGGNLPLLGAMILVLVGFAFKISVVPFHFWAPDVYEGAPTPIAGFLSTASKAAGFAVLARVFLEVFQDSSGLWGSLLAVISVATMTLGNLLALTQKNIKRLLAYSSIAHAGYVLIGLVVTTERGVSSLVMYLLVYLVTNLAAFGAVTMISRSIGSDEISAYAGLSRRSPGMALALLVSFLSLAGMPPLGGFVIKFLVFASAVEANMVWLAVVGVLNSIIGLYYYLIVLKVVYLFPSEKGEEALAIPKPSALALGILTFGIILLGTVFAPWVNWAVQAAAAIF